MQRPGKVGQRGRFMGVLVEKLPDRLPPFGLPRTLKSPENPLPDQRQQPGKVGDTLFIRRRQSGMGSLEAGRRCGVILTGGSTAERAEVTVPGGRFTGFDRISGGEAKALSPSRILADLPPLSLILLIFER